ncbi:hypothetical protein KUTeg_021534 [Tegillarca granosa]|uniref:Ankyrin repeat domain-containing protein 45 n=1 Tax=Tegillarca granosa TaxID=220873 RepID=A0ABQ9E934_TEGGR|nr:hypothetical protein KUTeg_021534 [Tegillarca granosa]
MTGTPEQPVESEPEVEILLPNTTIVTHCVLKNDTERLTKSFEDPEDPYKESVEELINTRGEDGKAPLDLAATLGRIDFTKELIQRGADVNATTVKGFCALHHAAAWGRIGVLKVLVEANANLQQRNIHNERPRETALRYEKIECVDYLDWAEAKVSLLDTIRTAQETITDPEKVQGRLTKEDKNIVVNTCKEKTEWIETTADATTQDFISQKQAIDEVFAPILQKLNEPPPEKLEKSYELT